MKFKGTKSALVRSLKLIPSVLAGHHPDALGIAPVFFGHVGNTVLRLISEDFEARLAGGAAKDGSTWAPLAEATIAKRRREGRSDDEILIESRSLLASLRPGLEHYAAGIAGQVFDIAPGSVTVGSQVEYADFHQRGVPGKLPARPIVPPTGDIPAAWEPELSRSCEEAMTRVIEMVVNAGGIT